MAAHDSDRYVAVHDDVVVGVPGATRPQLMEFLRGGGTEKHFAAGANAQARSSNAASPNS